MAVRRISLSFWHIRDDSFETQSQVGRIVLLTKLPPSRCRSSDRGPARGVNILYGANIKKGGVA